MDDNNGKENGLYEIKSSLKIDRSRENDAIYLRTNQFSRVSVRFVLKLKGIYESLIVKISKTRYLIT